VKIGGERHTVL